jgi:hypothetical protein
MADVREMLSLIGLYITSSSYVADGKAIVKKVILLALPIAIVKMKLLSGVNFNSHQFTCTIHISYAVDPHHIEY